MAPSVVQVAPSNTFSGNVTVNNTVVLVVGEFSAPTVTVTAVELGSTPVPFTQQLVFPQTAGGGSPQGVCLVMLPNVQVSGQTVVNFTCSGSVIADAVIEIAGLGPNPTMEQVVSAVGATASIASGSTPNTVVAQQIILGAAASFNGTSTAPTGASWICGVSNNLLGIGGHLTVGWVIQSAGSVNYAFNQVTGGATGWAAAVATLYAGGIAGTASNTSTASGALRETMGFGGTASNASVAAGNATLIPTLVQVQNADGNSSATLSVAITTTAGNTLVATITGWMTSNTTLQLVSVSDNAVGGSNVWRYSTLANNVNPPAAGAFNVGPGQYCFTAQAVCLPSDNSSTTKAVTTVNVTFNVTPTSWSEVGVAEIKGLPTNATLAASAVTTTQSLGVTSYTTPSITPLGTVTSFVSTTNFGQFTGVSAGWNVLSEPDAIAGYALAVSGTIAPTFTLTSAADIPASTIIAIGVASIDALAGTASNASSASGALTLLAKLAGTASNASSASGAFTAQTFAGTSPTTSHASGAFTPQVLVGTASSSSSASGALTLVIPPDMIVGTASNTSTASGSLTLILTMRGTASTVTVGLGSLFIGGTIRHPLNLSGTLTEDPDYSGTIVPEVINGTIVRVTTVYNGTAARATVIYNATIVGWTMQEVDITLAEFNDETFDLALLTSGGGALNITGFELDMFLKSAAGTPDSAATKLSTVTGEIVITNAAGGLATVAIPSADIGIGANYGFYRVDAVNGGFRNTAIFGKVAVTPL